MASNDLHGCGGMRSSSMKISISEKKNCPIYPVRQCARSWLVLVALFSAEIWLYVATLCDCSCKQTSEIDAEDRHVLHTGTDETTAIHRNEIAAAMHGWREMRIRRRGRMEQRCACCSSHKDSRSRFHPPTHTHLHNCAPVAYSFQRQHNQQIEHKSDMTKCITTHFVCFARKMRYLALLKTDPPKTDLILAAAATLRSPCLFPNIKTILFHSEIRASYFIRLPQI